MVTINFYSGGIFDIDADAIVNPVNTDGIMGAGLALVFKRKYPLNYYQYRAACIEKNIRIGKCLVVTERTEPYKFIVNFPTKTHYNLNSNLDYIDLGMKDLIDIIRNNNIGSINIPKLGCGFGNLDWGEVKKIIIKHTQYIDRECIINIF